MKIPAGNNDFMSGGMMCSVDDDFLNSKQLFSDRAIMRINPILYNAARISDYTKNHHKFENTQRWSSSSKWKLMPDNRASGNVAVNNTAQQLIQIFSAVRLRTHVGTIRNNVLMICKKLWVNSTNQLITWMKKITIGEHLIYFKRLKLYYWPVNQSQNIL